MWNRTLGTIGMLGAPFLCIDLIFHSGKANGEAYTHTSLGGIFSLLYITAWMCSIIGLWRLQATGKNKSGKTLLVIILITLTLANGWNVYEIIDPQANTPLYALLDMFWPISNLVMFIVGIAVIVARKLTGWKRFVPLLVGLWFPISICLFLLLGRTIMVMYLSGLYSAINWIVLGYVVRISEPAKFKNRFPGNSKGAGSFATAAREASTAANG